MAKVICVFRSQHRLKPSQAGSNLCVKTSDSRTLNMKDDVDTTSQATSAPSVTKRSEFDLIETLRQRAAQNSNANTAILQGIGDDAAILNQISGRSTVITSDLLVEDIDFRRDSTLPRLLGHKALAVSLSDIAAMGARPKWALSSIGVPNHVWESKFVDDFYDGWFSLATRYDVKLIGGDISRSPEKMLIDSIVIGECESTRAVLRSTAKAGDRLFVTGSLGGAAAGCRLLERGARLSTPASDEDWEAIQALLLHHSSPEPRVGWGMVLGQERLANSMIDISDGLSSDLHHLCSESRVGALIDSGKIPVDSITKQLSGRRALDPLMLALHGGEDFELLFSVSPENIPRLPRRVDGVGITEIGEIRPLNEGVRISEGSRVWELTAEGWLHF
jgi:thiamine-monophosphate kinase